MATYNSISIINVWFVQNTINLLSFFLSFFHEFQYQPHRYQMLYIYYIYTNCSKMHLRILFGMQQRKNKQKAKIKKNRWTKSLNIMAEAKTDYEVDRMMPLLLVHCSAGGDLPSVWLVTEISMNYIRREREKKRDTLSILVFVVFDFSSAFNPFAVKGTAHASGFCVFGMLILLRLQTQTSLSISESISSSFNNTNRM